MFECVNCKAFNRSECKCDQLCAKCHTTVTLNDVCEWPDDGDLYCWECAHDRIEELEAELGTIKNPYSACPFEVGQRVRHAGSGEESVVTAIHGRCTAHTEIEHLWKNMNARDAPKDPCNYVLTGNVSVSTGFGKDDFKVGWSLLKAVGQQEGCSNG